MLLLYSGTIKVNHYSIRRNHENEFFIDIDIEVKSIHCDKTLDATQ